LENELCDEDAVVQTLSSEKLVDGKGLESLLPPSREGQSEEGGIKDFSCLKKQTIWPEILRVDLDAGIVMTAN